MDLFHFQEEGPGAIFWHPKGWALFQNVISYMRRRLKADYQEVNAPLLLDKSLWETSGHWEWFRENMFVSAPAREQTDEDRLYAIKPMNCPGHIQIFKHGLKSYRDLPLRMAEFGVVHRYEPSGALHGLLRVRAFTQDHAHVFYTETGRWPKNASRSTISFCRPTPISASRSRREALDAPEKRVGSDEAWDEAEAIMTRVLTIEAGSGGTSRRASIRARGAFYAQFEYTLPRDAIGREWQCRTTQVDFNLPSRFVAYYIGPDSEKKTPVMIHRAIFGSLERFTRVLIDTSAGHLPLWLSPLQIVICTITQDADDYAYEVAAARRESSGLRSRSTRPTRRSPASCANIRSRRFPCCSSRAKRGGRAHVSMRRLGSRAQTQLSLDEALKRLAEEATPAGSAGIVLSQGADAENAIPLPLGEGGPAEPGRGGAAPLTRQAIFPHPSRFARHLLPMGERCRRFSANSGRRKRKPRRKRRGQMSKQKAKL